MHRFELLILAHHKIILDIISTMDTKLLLEDILVNTATTKNLIQLP